MHQLIERFIDPQTPNIAFSPATLLFLIISFCVVSILPCLFIAGMQGVFPSKAIPPTADSNPPSKVAKLPSMQRRNWIQQLGLGGGFYFFWQLKMSKKVWKMDISTVSMHVEFPPFPLPSPHLSLHPVIYDMTWAKGQQQRSSVPTYMGIIPERESPGKRNTHATQTGCGSRQGLLGENTALFSSQHSTADSTRTRAHVNY